MFVAEKVVLLLVFSLTASKHPMLHRSHYDVIVYVVVWYGGSVNILF